MDSPLINNMTVPDILAEIQASHAITDALLTEAEQTMRQIQKTLVHLDNPSSPARVTRHHRLLCSLGRHQDTDLSPMYSEMGTVTLLACERCGRVRAW